MFSLNPFKKKPEPKRLLVIKKTAMPAEEAKKLGIATGRIVVMVDDMDDIREMNVDEPLAEADGNAVFLDEGTHEEYQDMLKEESGIKPWYDIFGKSHE